MTIRQTIAEHGTEICLGTLGMASVGASAVAVPMAVLATLGAERLQECDRAILRRARQAIEHLQALNALDGGEAQRTCDLLQGAHLKLRFSGDDLLTLRESPTLPDDLIARILPATDLAHETAAVRKALGEVLTTAFAQLFSAGKSRDAVNFAALLRILDRQKDQIDGWAAFQDTATRRHAELIDGIDATRDDIALVHTQVTATRAALENLTTANRDMLEALASRFGIEAIFDKSDAELRRLLDLKAQEYRAYRAEIEAIDERTKGLGNLKAAARDAADRLDFEEVETLLSRVHEVEVEIAAETAELRATNALLRGRVDQAFALLSAAADSFASIDPLEPARRRIEYMKPICFQALSYGGPGILQSIAMLRHDSLRNLVRRDPSLWGTAQNNLGNALQEQGSRSHGPEGTDFLGQAVQAYRDALTIRTRADYPVDWAATQNNLGNALQQQGSRIAGTEGTDLLEQAVRAYRAALTVSTRAECPADWAITQNNLAAALQMQGIRSKGAEGADLLAKAVTAYRDAQAVRTRADHPIVWAETQNNLANALQEQGSRTVGAEGADLLSQAVRAYRDALSVRTRADHPMDWAATQNNLANTLHVQASRAAAPDGLDLLSQAVRAFRSALDVFNHTDHSVHRATTQENLAEIELTIAEHAATGDPKPHLEDALSHVEAALTIYDPDHMPYYFEKASKLRDDIRTRLSRT